MKAANTSLLFLSVLLMVVLSLPEAAGPHVVIVTEDAEEASRRFLEQWADDLRVRFGFHTSLVAGRDGEPDSIITDADLLVLDLERLKLSGRQRDLLREHFESGRPAIGVGAASTDESTWIAGYLGARHWTREGREVQTMALPGMDHHPVLRGVPRHQRNQGRPFYLARSLSGTATPLVLGRVDDTAPAGVFAWVNEFRPGSRHFQLATGNLESLGLPGNRALLYNAVFWALGREIPLTGVLGLERTTGRSSPRIAYDRPPLRERPAGASVLFDGTDLREWDNWFEGKSGQDHLGGNLGEKESSVSGAGWSVEGEAVVASPGYGDIATRRRFGDAKIHLDFLVPRVPAGVERIWRGNSGVYVNGRYEIQILDSSHEAEAETGSCGSLNGFRPPDRLACREPEQWQNLQIVFRAARFSATQEPARLTVTLNGVTIHDNVEIPTEIFPEARDSGPLLGPLRLQADSSSVRFANIWVEPLSEEEVNFYFPKARPKTGDRWVDMDYGPFFTGSIESPQPEGNIAYKGIAIPMRKIYGDEYDEAVIFDTDLLRYSVGWKGNFVNLRGVPFDGTHNTHPLIDGQTVFSNPVAPGWARLGSFEDPRALRWGPLPRDWAHFKGLYLHQNRVIFSYTVGSTSVMETAGLEQIESRAAFVREINLGPSEEELIMQLAAAPSRQPRLLSLETLASVTEGTEAKDSLLAVSSGTEILAAAAVGAPLGSRWIGTEKGDLRLKIPPASGDRSFKVMLWKGPRAGLSALVRQIRRSSPARNLALLTQGGPPRWRQKLQTRGQLGDQHVPYTVDTISWPAENPWGSWMRFGGFDFFADGRRAAVGTWNGDVWLVSGIGSTLETLTWQRIATGLFQPLGVKIVDEKIYVLGRDQITILRDLNGDGETDYYENFNNDHQVTEHFHEFAMDLQTDAKGDFYYMKGGRHALDSLIPQHGTLMRVERDGSRAEILANGFRAPNGLLITPDGEFISSDQQGHWVPANRINVIQPGRFYGYMWSYHQGEPPDRFEEPVAWIHPSINRSPSTFVWVGSDRWGPFEERIVAPSYGTGRLELIFRETIAGVMQGGLTQFPLDFDTGIMRGRFHPGDGQLYVCGLYGWAGNKTRPGGFYRIRYTGLPVHMPSELRVARDGVIIHFTSPLDPRSATDPGNYHVQVWNYRWTEQYGSPDFKLSGEEGRDRLSVQAVTLSRDRRSVFLKLDTLRPVMQMHVDLNLKSARGSPIRTFVHNTIHKLGDRGGEAMLGPTWWRGDDRPPGWHLTNAAPGLIQEIRSIGAEPVQPDARPARLVSLSVPSDQPPSPFLPPGQFRSRWRGFLRMDLSEEVRFYPEGRGQVRLLVNGSEVSFTGSAGVSDAVALPGGLTPVEVEYTSPADGDALFRLTWASSERPREPVPPTALVHDDQDALLQEGQNQREGRRLFAEGRCIRCHLPGDRFEQESSMPELNWRAQELDGIGSRLKSAWLRQWILNPSALKRHAKMPSLLHGEGAESQAADIARFLSSLKSTGGGETDISARLSDSVVTAGSALFEILGCVACHRVSGNDPELLPLDHVAAKWQPGALVEYLLEPERHDPWSPMPNFGLGRTEALSLAAFLLSRAARSVPGPEGVVEGDLQRGRELVASLGCLNCHQLSGVSTVLEAPSLRDLTGKSWATGCLASQEPSSRRSPDFAFGSPELVRLNTFLRGQSDSLSRRDWSEFAARQRERLRCRGCHELDTDKGRWSPLTALVGESPPIAPPEEETIHLKIPPLTWAGEQFKPDWMERLIDGGLSVKTRPRLMARMPAFPAYAPGLVRGLRQEHGVSEAEIEVDVRSDRVAMGRRLIEKDALGCVDCHPSAARSALAGPDTETISMDLITRRLRYDFYWRFLQDPQRILPGTMMPTFMDAGQSTFRTIYEGDAEAQAEALWHFMRSLER